MRVKSDRRGELPIPWLPMAESVMTDWLPGASGLLICRAERNGRQCHGDTMRRET